MALSVSVTVVDALPEPDGSGRLAAGTLHQARPERFAPPQPATLPVDAGGVATSPLYALSDGAGQIVVTVPARLNGWTAAGDPRPLRARLQQVPPGTPGADGLGLGRLILGLEPGTVKGASTPTGGPVSVTVPIEIAHL